MDLNPGKDIEPGKMETPRRMDDAQENPLLIEILRRNGGDVQSAAEELTERGLENPDARAALARLLHEWDRFKEQSTIH